jgi:hypothetical protein
VRVRLPHGGAEPRLRIHRVRKEVSIRSREPNTIATEIRDPWNVGDQGKSGLVVLSVSFVARDPL